MRKSPVFLVFLSFLFSACNLPARSPGTQAFAARAWFDAPLPGTVVRPPNPCQIVAHGASTSGITAFELSVNGVARARIPSPDSQGTLVLLTQECGLSAPGRYVLQLRAEDRAGNWSDTAETDLTIVAGETPTATPTAIEAATPTSTGTPASAPSLTPTVAMTGAVSIERISTDLVYVGQASCGPLQVTIAAHATAPKGIAVVVLFYRFSTGSSSSGFESVAMNPIGGDLYQQALNPTSLLGNSIPFDQATLQYQIVVQQTGGDTSIRTPVMADIAVQACGTTSPAACSSFTTKRSCEANGCNWVPIPGTVPLYECKNP